MKSPFGKISGFKLHGMGGSDAKDRRDLLPSAHLDDLAQAAQDMQDMRDCYDSLLSAAASAANSAYEFSESLREMGSCLVEKKTALHDDEESGRVLLMLGKVQFELQKLVDSYRSHIFSTITNPSESLLNELRNVEDMKRQCDEKRNVYEYMLAQQKEKGKSKGAKGDQFTLQQLQTAHDEYGEDATFCVFRLKSLKQGQSRSLLTQAARHHAAQLNFFRKGLESLEAIEPHIRLVAEQHHIDYHFHGLEDDGKEYGENDDDHDENINEDRELSFDYRTSKQGHHVSASSYSMEVDEDDISFPQASTAPSTELNPDKNQGGLHTLSSEHRASSYSAPMFLERKSDPAEKLKQVLQPSTKKSNTYVLPTPSDAKGAIFSRTSTSGTHPRPTDLGGRAHNLWHSSPLDQKKHGKDYGEGHMSETTNWKTPLAHKEKSSDNASVQLPPPLVEGISFPQLNAYNASDSKKIKRLSYSGPIISKPSSAKHAFSGPISAGDLSQQVSGSLTRVPISQTTSPAKVSPSTSPPLVSSPRISELHELPRPPANLASRPVKSSGLIGHSAPLVRGSEHAGNKISSTGSNFASPLPVPPLVVPRSLSIPSSGQRSTTVHISKLLGPPKVPFNSEEADSPPLTPISLANIKPATAASAFTPQSGQIRGGS